MKLVGQRFRVAEVAVGTDVVVRFVRLEGINWLWW